MRDRFFFPLAALLAALLVLGAMWPGFNRMPEAPFTGDGGDYDTLVIEGPYLNTVVSGGDALVDLIEDTESESYTLLLRHSVGRLRDDPRLGPHFELGADIEWRYAGWDIEVTVHAKPDVSTGPGANEFQMNYSAGRAGESGWKTFDIGGDYQDFSFRYRVPLIEGEQGLDYLAIRPVVPKKSRGILVKRVTLKRIEPWSEEARR